MKDPGPVSQNLTFSVWFKRKKNSIYFTLWLLDFEEENIQLCIKTRYQGFFCSGRCIYRVLVYSRNSSFVHLCLGYDNGVEWNLLLDPGDKWVVTRWNFNHLCGHLLSPLFKVMVKWPYWRVSRQDHMLKNLCTVLKFWGVSPLRSISGGVCCVVLCTVCDTSLQYLH